LIADNKRTIFPLAQETERPDKVASAVLEGRVAILVDKSPFAIIVPVTSAEFYQTPEDYYVNYWIASSIKVLRAIGTVISLTLAGFYVATMSINPEFLPASLVRVLSAGRVLIPFPIVFELLIALLIFEIFREAIIRVPGNISLVLGIAGGVLLGLVGIQAGILSNSTAIVVIITALANFSTATTEQEQALRFIRYFLILSAAVFGVLGLTLGGLVIVTHLSSLKSFGVSYLAPWGPPIPSDMPDGFVRLPWWVRQKRPVTYRPQDIARQDSSNEEE
jgi:spore germination protein KA